MKHKNSLSQLLQFTAIYLILTTTSPAQDFSGMRAEEIYQNLCATCHGAEFEGGLAGSLADGEWIHGNSDEQIQHSITDGIPDKGMEAFGDVLTVSQVRGLVVLIREREQEEHYRTATYPVPDPENVTRTRYHAYRVEILTEGLHTPWAVAFLPDGRKLVTERSGPLRIIDADNRLDPEPVEGIPQAVFNGPEGGMMDVALHPDFEKNGWIYLALVDGLRDENGDSITETAVVRGRIDGHRWVDQEWIYKADPKSYTRSGAHYGTRIAFDNGYIYFAIGQRGDRDDPQDLSSPNGKIFRLYDDGRIPEDNPFVDDPNALAGIWSYGHRNPQGLTIDEETHDLYETEHGARGGDEFNLILKGRNYGWPVITHGMNYNGTPITPYTEMEGMEQPLVHWTPSIAPCGLDQYRGTAFPQWDGDILAGSLRAQELHRLRVRDGTVVEEEVILKGIGRVRDVRIGPEGYIYLLTNTDPDRLVRLLPADVYKHQLEDISKEPANKM